MTAISRLPDSRHCFDECTQPHPLPATRPRTSSLLDACGAIMNPIYLDYNATTPLDPAVVETMLPYLREHFGNPSSTHEYGKRAHDAVEQARAQVAALLGAAPDEIVFTGGGSEASNQALKGP